MRWGLVLAASILASSAFGSERRFTYAYDTGVMPQGAKELELQSSANFDHAGGGWVNEERAEFEVGLTEKLQTSIYLNLESAIPEQAKNAELAWSVSNEWKLKLSDSFADPVGFGLYGELTAGFHGLELEAKALFDKRVGPWLFALNLIGAHEWEFTSGAPNRDEEFEGDLGAAYFLDPKISFGLEAVSHGVQASDNGFEGNAFYAGPVFTYAGQTAWVSASVLPRFAQIRPSGSSADVENGWLARVLFGFHI
jgi:hypothetical protein